MHTRQPVIERDEFRVFPSLIHQVHEFPQLFEAEQKKQVRVPVSPEMPPSCRKCFSISLGALRRLGLTPAQRNNHHRHDDLCA
jgi:hypothetical protein